MNRIQKTSRMPIPSSRSLQVPMAGIALFILGYARAAMTYPGGIRWADADRGFSLRDSYWCDLLAPLTRAGSTNPSQGIALAAMAVLCASLAWMWWHIPRRTTPPRSAAFTQQWCGPAAMAAAMLLFTPLHDQVLHVAGILGILAFLGTLRTLHHLGRKTLWLSGLGCSCLALSNYVIYDTAWGLDALPLLQKITFGIFLVWFLALIRDMDRWPAGTVGARD